MKRIAYALALVLALAGCAGAPAKYDPFEHFAYSVLWQQARVLEKACDDRGDRDLRAAVLRETTDMLTAYARYQADPGVAEMADAFDRLLAHFNPRGGAAYCRESALNLQAAAVRAMQTTGRRGR